MLLPSDKDSHLNREQSETYKSAGVSVHGGILAVWSFCVRPPHWSGILKLLLSLSIYPL